MRVNATRFRSFLRRLPAVRVAAVLLALGAGGCATSSEGPRLGSKWRDAEIAVSNLTPYPWRIALRSAESAEPKLVQVQPRESFAVVVAGGDYQIEQALVATDPTVAMSRSFNARFEAGERYEWNLATLLSAETPVAP